jgi:hypothetical protein
LVSIATGLHLLTAPLTQLNTRWARIQWTVPRHTSQLPQPSSGIRSSYPYAR